MTFVINACNHDKSILIFYRVRVPYSQQDFALKLAILRISDGKFQHTKEIIAQKLVSLVNVDAERKKHALISILTKKTNRIQLHPYTDRISTLSNILE